MSHKRIMAAAFLVILGILLLIELVFNIEMHVWGTAFALFLVFMGVSLLTGNSRRARTQPMGAPSGAAEQLWFSGGYYEAGRDNTSFEAFFSNAQVRIPTDAAPNVEVQSVFSSVTVFVPANRRVNLIMESVFGAVNPPEGASVSFGDGSAMFGEGDILNLRVSSVFGTIIVQIYEGQEAPQG